MGKKMSCSTGAQEMHNYLKVEGARFKNLVRDADNDHLYENRVDYNSAAHRRHLMRNPARSPPRNPNSPYREAIDLRGTLQNQWLSLYGFRDQGGDDLGEKKLRPRGNKMKKIEVARDIASKTQQVERRSSHSKRKALVPLEVKAPPELVEGGEGASPGSEISLTTSDSESEVDAPQATNFMGELRGRFKKHASMAQAK